MVKYNYCAGPITNSLMLETYFLVLLREHWIKKSAVGVQILVEAQKAEELGSQKLQADSSSYRPGCHLWGQILVVSLALIAIYSHQLKKWQQKKSIYLNLKLKETKQKCLKLILRSQTVLDLIEICGDSHTISVAPILMVKWKISVHKTDYPRDITTYIITTKWKSVLRVSLNRYRLKFG